jgi:hypothetical protein
MALQSVAFKVQLKRSLGPQFTRLTKHRTMKHITTTIAVVAKASVCRATYLHHSEDYGFIDKAISGVGGRSRFIRRLNR